MIAQQPPVVVAGRVALVALGWSPAQVEAMTNQKVRTALRTLHGRGLRFVRISGELRYRVTELERFAAEIETDAGAEAMSAWKGD